MGSFVAGYLLAHRKILPKKELLASLAIIVVAAGLAGAGAIAFVKTRADTVQTIQNTAYPGHRVVLSGGYDLPHLLASNYAPLFQANSRGNSYKIFSDTKLNQSESSNFILLIPFLAPLALYLLYKDWRNKKPTDWPLVFVVAMFGIFLAWLYVPGIDILGKVFLLNQVPDTRLLIGVGLLNLLCLLLLMRRWDAAKTPWLKSRPAVVVAGVIFIAEIIVGFITWKRSPGFVHLPEVVALALPLPLITYWLVRKKPLWAAGGLLLFSFASVVLINPLYAGMGQIVQTSVSTHIKSIAAADPAGRWAIEPDYLENFAIVNGAKSLSGTYSYPQLDLWSHLDASPDIYNRYAHVQFAFDRDTQTQTPTQLNLITPDHFVVATEPCSDYLRQHHVRYLLTAKPIDADCLELRHNLRYPARSFYIYALR